ncbi:MAG: cupin domain-containing protein, partial [Bacilli bacterium]|nr:cupin domain-containing protein [Bacilli bacterium]
IPKGSSIGIHTHEIDEEVIYVLKNKGVIIVDGIESQLTEGMISLCKRGRNHSIKNIYDEDLVLLAVVNE